MTDENPRRVRKYLSYVGFSYLGTWGWPSRGGTLILESILFNEAYFSRSGRASTLIYRRFTRDIRKIVLYDENALPLKHPN